MNPWTPDDNPRQARRVGKTIEEAGELIAVLGRISIQGLDAIDPGTGRTNRDRLMDEVADMRAQLVCTCADLDLDLWRIEARVIEKVAQMRQWEAHFTP